MAVVLICPSCQHALSVSRAPAPRTCARCGQSLPSEAVEAVDESLAAEPVPRPLLVTLGAGFSALWGGAAVLVIAGSVLSSGPYRINGELVSKHEFVTSPIVGFFALAATYALATSFCVFKRWYPARRLMILPWIVAILSYFAVPLPNESSRFTGAGVGLLCLLVVLWYLYRKPNVRAYFDQLEADASARAQLTTLAADKRG